MLIEDYGLIGDTHTAALVGKDGSIDWLCVPRFDSAACFARLLGDEQNGYWRLAPVGEYKVSRAYRPGSLVLETEFQTPSGAVRVADCMPVRERYPEVVRLVRGIRGRVPMRMELVVRFGYGSILPWVHRSGGLRVAAAGPDALAFWSPVEVHGEGFSTVANFEVPEGAEVPFIISWYPSHLRAPRPADGRYAVDETERWWSRWSSSCRYQGAYRDLVIRSLCTLKALTYAPTGGIVAAPTTSLPEILGGSRNWDYRYCWLRDATFCLMALMEAGYRAEAAAWRDWLLRSVAGDPAALQIMYGPAGERDLTEREAPWLKGYEGSRPVRIGNAASGQFQLDVYGEVCDSLHQATLEGVGRDEDVWGLRQVLMEFLESNWARPDRGIWEVRGPERHFTHSKVMAWVAADRAVSAVERLGADGPVDRWRALRDQIREEVLEKGYSAELGSFVQYYGSQDPDASLLLIPLVGFLPASDPRVQGTVRLVEKRLLREGFVMRYPPEAQGSVDGIYEPEGAFLACSFWLADNYALGGRTTEAKRLFERLAGLANDLGLLSEEYDPDRGRLVGNFPQAFSHVSLVNTAFNLASGRRRAPRHLHDVDD